MIGLENQVAGREQNFSHLGILPDLFAHRGDDEAVMFARFGGAILHLPALERNPRDAELHQVLLGEITGAFGVERRHLRDLFPRVAPRHAGRVGARVVRAFGIFHHLPEAFEAGVALAAKRERRRCEVGEQAEFVAFGENDFARAGSLWENFPCGHAIGGNRRPPVRGIIGARREKFRGCARLNLRRAAAAKRSQRHEQNEKPAPN